MKKRNINLILILTFLIFILIKPVSADVIPMDSHKLDKCVKFTNLDNFPNIVLIGYIGAMMNQNRGYRVENNKCLTKGYKFNNLYTLWTTKDKFKKIGDLKKLDLGRELKSDIKISENLNLLLSNIDSYGGYISNDNPLKEQTVYYSLAKDTNGEIFAYKSKEIKWFNNGKNKQVKRFDKPANKPSDKSKEDGPKQLTEEELEKKYERQRKETKYELLKIQINNLEKDLSRVNTDKKKNSLQAQISKKENELSNLSKELDAMKKKEKQENDEVEKHKKSEEFEEKEKVKKDKEEENQQAKKQETKKPDSSENNNKEDSEKEINKQKQTSVFQLKALWQGIKNIFKQIFAIYK